MKANSRNHVQLPLIRRAPAAGLFPWGPTSHVCLYEQALVLVSTGRGQSLPLSCYRQPPTPTDTKEKLNVRELSVFNLSEVGKVFVQPGRKCVRFQVTGGTGEAEFTLAPEDGMLMAQALERLMGARFESSQAVEALESSSRSDHWGDLALASFGLVASLLLVVLLSRSDWVLRLGPLSMILMTLAIIGQFLSMATLVEAFVNNVIERKSSHRRGMEPYRSATLSRILRLAAIPVFIAGYIFAPAIVEALPDRLFGGAERSVDSLLTQSVASLLLTLAVSLAYVGYRLRGRSWDPSADMSGATLFLRGFHDDGRHSLNPDTVSARFLGLRPFKRFARMGPVANTHPLRFLRLVLGTARDTVEEQLAPYFRKTGPFVALGSPGEHLSTGGADRTYLPDKAWQAEARRMITSSRQVVIQPSRTPSVAWELGEAVRVLKPEQLVLCVAHLKEANGLNPYAHFRKSFETLTGIVLPEKIGDAVFIRFEPEWKPVLLPPVYYSPFAWPLWGSAVNLRRTLEGPRAGAGAAPEEGIPRRSSIPRFRAIAAAFFWTLFPVVAVNQLAGAIASHQISGVLAGEPKTARSGRSPGYVWELGPAWVDVKEQERGEADFQSVSWLKGREVAAASVFVQDTQPGGSEVLRRAWAGWLVDAAAQVIDLRVPQSGGVDNPSPKWMNGGDSPPANAADEAEMMRWLLTAMPARPAEEAYERGDINGASWEIMTVDAELFRPHDLHMQLASRDMLSSSGGGFGYSSEGREERRQVVEKQVRLLRACRVGTLNTVKRVVLAFHSGPLKQHVLVLSIDAEEAGAWLDHDGKGAIDLLKGFHFDSSVPAQGR